MTVALHGNLRDFGIGEVFQLIGQQRKTGALEVYGDELRIRIAFDHGSVVWGEVVGAYEEAGLGEMLVRTGVLTPERLLEIERDIEERDVRLSDVLRASGEISTDQLEDTIDLVTRDTVFELLRWSSGSFHFNAQPVSQQRDAGRLMPAEQILMDGLRMVDEWQTFDAEVLRPQSILRRVGHFDRYRQQMTGASPSQVARAERLFLLVDGKLDTERVMDLSRMGRFEAGRTLSDLRRAGMIEVVEVVDAVEGVRRKTMAEIASGPPFMAIALAVLPLLLLAALVVTSWWRYSQPIPPLEQTPTWVSDVEHRIEHAFEQRRLRHATESYRFAKGHWPAELQDLDELSSDSWTGMAPRAGREYYYDHRGETFMILAPEE